MALPDRSYPRWMSSNGKFRLANSGRRVLPKDQSTQVTSRQHRSNIGEPQSCCRGLNNRELRTVSKRSVMTTNSARPKRSASPAVFHVAPSALDATPTGDVDQWQTRLVFLSTALGAFLVTANVSTMNVAFPDLEQTYVDTSRGSLTWVLNAYTLSLIHI